MSRIYGYKNVDEEVLKSSSGGAFIALCFLFEKLHNGNVKYYGVAFDEQLEIVHVAVNSADECHIFQGSKYVRSICGTDVYAAVAKDLQDSSHVLFSGTPCQIHGLQSYLSAKNIYTDKLLTVDIICHGTPQRIVWEDYKKWLEHKYASKLIQYSFRYKPEGWKAYPGYAKFENCSEAVNTAETSVFSKMQMQGYITHKGCFSCRFSSQERISDITLGDFWGVEKIIPEIPHKKGVSLILSNTEKGEVLMQTLHQSLTDGQYLVETKDKTYLQYQHNLRQATPMPEHYDVFWSDYRQLGFQKVLEKYIGYGFKYKVMYSFKKFVRKTPMIEWYRNRKNKKEINR